ncbi:MAG: hypothetical protein H0U60_20085 [Blastocatellia bacterium]|nr:hypothetical protein [Blastocatellia bacterium]
MLTPEEITEQALLGVQNRESQVKETTFHKGLFLGLKVAMAQMVGAALKAVKKNTYSVKVENQITLPEIQQVEGSVSLKEIRTLVLGLDEVVKNLKSLADTGRENTKLLSKELKPERADFSTLEKAVKDIRIPETKIPEHPKTFAVNNFDELKKPLAELTSKLNIKFPDINIPPAPKNITVDNLEAIESLLAELSGKTEQIVNKDEAPDIEPLIKATKAVEFAINSLRFPIPTFRSSFDKSKTIQLYDAPKTLSYVSIGGEDYIQYMDAVSEGVTYRKTLSYTGSNLTSVSGWVAQ